MPFEEFKQPTALEYCTSPPYFKILSNILQCIMVSDVRSRCLGESAGKWDAQRLEKSGTSVSHKARRAERRGGLRKAAGEDRTQTKVMN